MNSYSCMNPAWIIHPPKIQSQILLFAVDTDAVEWDSQQYMRTEKVVTFNPLEDVIGATFHNEYLLIYSANILTIIDISQNSTLTPAYKFLTNFHPKKLGKIYNQSIKK